MLARGLLLVIVCTGVAAAVPCNYTLAPGPSFQTLAQGYLDGESATTPVTICLQPGQHRGCGDGLTMITNGGGSASLVGLLSVSGARPVVNCTSETGRMLHVADVGAVFSVRDVIFANGKEITTTNGGAVRVTSAQVITFERVDFVNTKHTAVYVDTTVSVYVQMYFTDCVFDSNNGLTTSNRFGGAIRAESEFTDLVIVRTVFSNNIARQGGAVYLFDKVNLVLQNCEFSDNSATAVGGGAIDAYYFNTLTTANTTFTGNTITGLSANGGALSLRRGTIGVIGNSTFENNESGSGEGGAAIFDEDAVVTVTNSTFTYNTAGTKGGAVMNKDNSWLTVSGSTFVANTANNGAGINSERTNAILVTIACSFINNTANVRGGGLFVFFSATVTVTNSTIVGNTAPLGGGFSLLRSVGAVVVDCDIVGNIATGTYGGGIHSERDVALSLRRSRVTRNYAVADGGGIYNKLGASSGDHNATLFETTVSCNEAVEGATGGVVAEGIGSFVVLRDESSVVANFFRGTATGDFNYSAPLGSFLANRAGVGGGVVEVLSGSVGMGGDICECAVFKGPSCLHGGVCTTDLDKPVSCDCSGAAAAAGYPGGEECGESLCGDGVTAGSEACDDGNGSDGDGCENNCTLSCGNGVTDFANNETCDDGNIFSGDGCSSDCQTVCGDGFIVGEEVCDDGNVEGGDGCEADCSLSCGNGVIDLANNETCDDANADDTDGCASNCTTVCGDGVAVGVEDCDDGNAVNGDGCDNDCRFSCGNGAVDAEEDCDDGNTADGDGCTSNCTTVCGDGFVVGLEVCDDGNTISGDGCEADCTLSCGNGLLELSLNESCDDGNVVDGDGCQADCTAVCGDGFVVPTAGEECDDGNAVDGDGCEANCTYSCGNWRVDSALGREECDDGNRVSGDGCSANCTIEGVSSTLTLATGGNSTSGANATATTNTAAATTTVSTATATTSVPLSPTTDVYSLASLSNTLPPTSDEPDNGGSSPTDPVCTDCVGDGLSSTTDGKGNILTRRTVVIGGASIGSTCTIVVCVACLGYMARHRSKHGVHPHDDIEADIMNADNSCGGGSSGEESVGEMERAWSGARAAWGADSASVDGDSQGSTAKPF